MAPKEDKERDWKVTTITEIDGVTTMEFNRKKDTGDTEGDNVIGVGTIISKHTDWTLRSGHEILSRSLFLCYVNDVWMT